jgi:hypothetical protein
VSPIPARWANALLSMLALGLSSAATADGLDDCLKLTAKPEGGARLTNACGSRLNIIYCIDQPDSAKTCASDSLPVTTLFPGADDVVPAYSGGALRAAICVYPEAPVGWRPGPDSPYTCKKTCVMC